MQAVGLLRADVRRQIEQIGRADIVVGIPSFNNAETIGHVVRTVKAGCARYFPGHKAVLVNSDGGSTDGTAQEARCAGNDNSTLFVNHSRRAVKKIITPYYGLPGKGSALRTVFLIASALKTRACAVFDSDLRSITPQWVERLLNPVLEEGFDYITPLYYRHKYDGTITNSIVYPLTRALYGRRIRQPIGGDFGMSGRLAEHYLGQDVWRTDVARFGVDIWMTTTAVCDGFKIGQAFLGAKIHDAKDPGADLSAMLKQVVGSLFSLMETNHSRWAGVKGSSEVPLFGFEHAVELEAVEVDVERMHSNFQAGAHESEAIWCRVLAPETYADVKALAAMPLAEFRYSTNLWVRTIYDYAAAWHRRAVNRKQLLDSLTPLYLGRTASFVLETVDADGIEVERTLDGLCREFEELKPYLLGRWNKYQAGFSALAATNQF